MREGIQHMLMPGWLASGPHTCTTCNSSSSCVSALGRKCAPTTTATRLPLLSCASGTCVHTCSCLSHAPHILVLLATNLSTVSACGQGLINVPLGLRHMCPLQQTELRAGKGARVRSSKSSRGLEAGQAFVVYCTDYRAGPGSAFEAD